MVGWDWIAKDVKKWLIALIKIYIYLLWGTEENHEWPNQIIQSPGRDLDVGTREYESGIANSVP
jgi:hypothetical protein